MVALYDVKDRYRVASIKKLLNNVSAYEARPTNYEVHILLLLLGHGGLRMSYLLEVVPLQASSKLWARDLLVLLRFRVLASNLKSTNSATIPPPSPPSLRPPKPASLFSGNHVQLSWRYPT